MLHEQVKQYIILHLAFAILTGYIVQPGHLLRKSRNSTAKGLAALMMDLTCGFIKPLLSASVIKTKSVSFSTGCYCRSEVLNFAFAYVQDLTIRLAAILAIEAKVGMLHEVSHSAVAYWASAYSPVCLKASRPSLPCFCL